MYHINCIVCNVSSISQAYVNNECFNFFSFSPTKGFSPLHKRRQIYELFSLNASQFNNLFMQCIKISRTNFVLV